MSALVSYGVGSSDESDGSDNEDTAVTQGAGFTKSVKPETEKAVGPTPRPQPSEKLPLAQKRTSLFANLPKPKSSSGVSQIEKHDHCIMPSDKSNGNSGDQHDHPEEQKKKSFFSSLPPPKMISASSNIKEPTNKPSAASTSEIPGSALSKGLLNLPPPKKKLHPVKIGVPSLPDPDSDEDEPEAKKPKSTKGAGLFSVLPKPKTAIRKEANRILIPYALTKKPTQPLKPSVIPAQVKPSPAQSKTATMAHSRKPAGVTQLITGYNSDDEDDDDDEGGNFFSMKDEIRTERSSVEIPQIQNMTSLPSSSLINPSGKVFESTKQSNLVSQSDDKKLQNNVVECRTSSETISTAESADPLAQDQPLVFSMSKSNAASSSAYLPHSFESAVHQPDYAHSSHISNYACDDGGVVNYTVYEQTGEGTPAAAGLQYYNQPYQEGSIQEEASPHTPDGKPEFYEDERFAKMVGKKNRGKEAVHIIDINADDQIGPNAGAQQSMKSMTEEKEYRGKLKKEQLPTSQQKRKHQITYLARQAKERELELKNQWADNRMTRKQTQAKYGF